MGVHEVGLGRNRLPIRIGGFQQIIVPFCQTARLIPSVGVCGVGFRQPCEQFAGRIVFALSLVQHCQPEESARTVGTNGEKALTIQYEFKLELDRNMTISDLQSAGVVDNPAVARLDIAPATPAELAQINAAIARLSPADQALARAQVFCAIDQDSRLGSMGPIQKIMIKNQPVFLCCKGCEAEARAHPEETLVKLHNLMSRMSRRP